MQKLTHFIVSKKWHNKILVGQLATFWPWGDQPHCPHGVSVYAIGSTLHSKCHSVLSGNSCRPCETPNQSQHANTVRTDIKTLLSSTCKDQTPGISRLKKCFKACKLPRQGPGQNPGKFEIWCNLIPQNSLQKCQMKFFAYYKHLIMNKNTRD